MATPKKQPAITERLNLIRVPLSRVFSKDWNPKTREDYRDEFERVRASILKEGICIPINVREIAKNKYEILDGEQRYAIYRDLGLSEITVNNLGKMDDARAKAFALNIEERVPFDEFKRTKLLGEIADAVGLQEALSMLTIDAEEIQARLSSLKAPIYEDLEIVASEERAGEKEAAQALYLKVELDTLQDIREKVPHRNGRITLAALASYLADNPPIP